MHSEWVLQGVPSSILRDLWFFIRSAARLHALLEGIHRSNLHQPLEHIIESLCSTVTSRAVVFSHLDSATQTPWVMGRQSCRHYSSISKLALVLTPLNIFDSTVLLLCCKLRDDRFEVDIRDTGGSTKVALYEQSSESVSFTMIRFSLLLNAW